MAKPGSIEYVHFVPPAKKDPNFPSAYRFILIDSMDMLRSVLDVEPTYASFDLETSGLNAEEDFIVGFTFSLDGRAGYYVPVRHFAPPNLGRESLDIIYDFMCKCKKVFMYNARFDMRMMEYVDYKEKYYKKDPMQKMYTYGYDMSKVNYFDVAVPVTLADSNIKYPSLKWAEKHFLGWEGVAEFEETLGENANFYYLSPEDATFYAATDSLGTFNLAKVTIKFYKEARLSGEIDNQVLYPLMKYEEQTTKINYNHLEQVRMETEKRLKEIESEIYSQVGYQFVINSPKQKSDALQSMGISTGEFTKLGYMKTGKKQLDKLKDGFKSRGEEVPPVIDLLLEYSLLFKSFSAYLDPLIKYSREKGGRLRFSYKTGYAPTGRLASGTDKKNDFFAKINVQAIPKPNPTMWYYRKASDNPTGEYPVICGFEFSETPFPDGPNDMWVEAARTKQNVRKSFEADEGFYWVSIDYNAQELRIPTNLCIGYDTEVETNYGKITLQKVKELKEQGKEVEVKTPVGMRKVTRFFDNGLQTKCRVTLDNGNQIICSPSHKFLVKTPYGYEFLPLFLIDIENDEIVGEEDNVDTEALREALRKLD